MRFQLARAAAILLVGTGLFPVTSLADNSVPAILSTPVTFGVQANENVITDLAGMTINSPVPINLEILSKWGEPLTLMLPNVIIPQGNYTVGEILSKLERASDAIHVHTTSTAIDVQIVLSPGVDDPLQYEVGPKYSKSITLTALFDELSAADSALGVCYQQDAYFILGIGLSNLLDNFASVPFDQPNLHKPIKLCDLLDKIGVQLDAHWIAIVRDRHPFKFGKIENGKTVVLGSFPNNLAGRAPICFYAVEHLNKPLPLP